MIRNQLYKIAKRFVERTERTETDINLDQLAKETKSGFVHELFLEAWNKGYIDRTPTFKIAGVNYYRASNGGVDLAFKRFDAATQFVAEYDKWGSTRELLSARIDVIKENCNKAIAEGDLAHVQESLKYIYMVEGDLVFSNKADEVLDVMSCFFFSANESPYHYDRPLNNEKKAFWAKNRDELDDFFFTRPFWDSMGMSSVFKSSTEFVMSLGGLRQQDVNLMEVAMLQRTALEAEINGKETGMASPLYWRSVMALQLIALNDRIRNASINTGNTP